MPISWLPLVSDYSRFARRPAPAFWGTTLGYLVANVWFYTLGALILLGMRTSPEPKAFVEAIALLAGPLVLLVLLADETDEAWADLYSCAVSVQNVFPRVSVRPLVGGLGAAVGRPGARLRRDPLRGLPPPDRRRLRAALRGAGGRLLRRPAGPLRRPRRSSRPPAAGGVAPGIRWQGVLAWMLGVGAYLWIAGRLEPLGLAGIPTVGASLPSLGLAAVVYLAVTRGETASRR